MRRIATTTVSGATTLYLRGMPIALVREAKAEAARQGKTLAKIVAEGLTLALRGSPPQQATTDELGPDVQWYERNRVSLLERYRGEYIAIVDGAAVDHDRDFERLARRVFGRFGTRSIFMPRVMDGSEQIQVRSPRLRASGQVRPSRPVRRSP